MVVWIFWGALLAEHHRNNHHQNVCDRRHHGHIDANGGLDETYALCHLFCIFGQESGFDYLVNEGNGLDLNDALCGGHFDCDARGTQSVSVSSDETMTTLHALTRVNSN